MAKNSPQAMGSLIPPNREAESRIKSTKALFISSLGNIRSKKHRQIVDLQFFAYLIDADIHLSQIYP